MDIDKIIKAKRRELTAPKPEQAVQPEPELEPLEMEQQPLDYLEPLSMPLRDESVYSTGWSLAELMNEFSQR